MNLIGVRKKLLSLGVVTALAVVAIVVATWYQNYLRTAVLQPANSVDTASGPIQEIAAGKISVRLSADEVVKLAQALEDVKDGQVLAAINSSSPEPTNSESSLPVVSDSPEPTKGEDPSVIPSPNKTPETSTPEERVNAAKATLPYLQEVNFVDISLITPVKLPDAKYNEPAFRWSTIDLLPKEEQRPIVVPDTTVRELTDPFNVDQASASDAPNKDSGTAFMSSEDRTALNQIQAVTGQLREANAAGKVEFIEPVMVVRHMAVNPDDDTYYNSSGAWGQTYQDLWGLHKIDAAGAWNQADGTGVTVAVIDSGIDYNHEDIAENIWTNAGEMGTDVSGNDKSTNGIDDDSNGYVDDWHGWDFANNDNDPMDDHGHGTHVAGTIAAVDNDRGVIGVAPKAKIMGLKGLFANGSGDGDDLAEAVVYSADMGASVNNNSWGGRGTYQAFNDAFDYAYFVKNATNIASAGNSSADTVYFSPASIRTVMAIGATDYQDLKASFSNWGDKVAVAAPGVNILSLRANNTDMNGHSSNIIDDKYFYASGTSMSAPHVAGLAALVRQRQPDFLAGEVYNVMATNADSIAATNIGSGRINAASSVADENPMPVALVVNLSEAELLDLSNNDLISINGVAAGQNFSSYRIEVGRGYEPTDWASSGITLTQGGTAPVVNGLLGTWDTSQYQDGIYAVRLIVSSQTGTEQVFKLSKLILDHTVRDGWPVEPMLGGAASWNSAGVGNFDDNTATREIVNVEEYYDYYGPEGDFIAINIHDANGSILPGWPVELPKHNGHVVALADLNNDGRDEIILNGVEYIPGTETFQRKIYVYMADGTLAQGWPKDVEGNPHNNALGLPAVADLDGNGTKEFIILSCDGTIKLHAWGFDANEVSGWPVEVSAPAGKQLTCGDQYTYGLDHGVKHAVVAVDVDNDDQEEIIISVYDQFYEAWVYLLNNDGSVRPGWPVGYESYENRLGTSNIMPLVGNIWGDSVPEIIVINRDSQSSILNTNGQWIRQEGRLPEHLPNGSVYLPPALKDITGDGLLDIVYGRLAVRGALALTEGWIPGWPPDLLSYLQEPIREKTRSHILADVDGDNNIEIVGYNPRIPVAPEDDEPFDNYVFHAYKDDHSDAAEWPKYPTLKSGKEGWSSPLAEDLDGDGTIEIILPLVDGRIIVYNTPGLASAGTWPLAFKNAQNNLGYQYAENPLPVCGNNILEHAEECDDGNTQQGDGCGGFCNVEDDLIQEAISDGYFQFDRADHSDEYCEHDELGETCQTYVAEYMAQYSGTSLTSTGDTLALVEYKENLINLAAFNYEYLPNNPSSGIYSSVDTYSRVDSYNGNIYYSWGSREYNSDTYYNNRYYRWFKGHRAFLVLFVNIPEGFTDEDRLDELAHAYLDKHGSDLQHNGATCGNWIEELATGEQCDDGNTTDGDGCSSICEIEPEEITLNTDSGNDNIVITPGSVTAGTDHIVTINGNEQTYNPAATITITDAGGTDTLLINGTDQDETVTLTPGSVDLLGQSYQIHGTNLETISVEAGTGNDQVTMTGSAASNRLYSYADYARLSDSSGTFSYRVEEFDGVTVDVPAGGSHYAILYDTPNNDELEADPSQVMLTRNAETPDETETTATGFERVYIYASQGGTDTADLTGSDTASNRFYGYADYSVLTESSRSFYFYARGFDTVTAESPGSDTTYAYLYDSPGIDSLEATPAYAAMDREAPWSDTTATGFSRVYTYSTRGSDDLATLQGNSVGVNTLRAYPTYSTLTDQSMSFYHYARGFRWTTAEGSETDLSGDRAYMYDSPGDDIFYDDTTYAYLQDVGLTYQNRVKYFDIIYARSSDSGTNDTIDIDPERELAYQLVRLGSW